MTIAQEEPCSQTQLASALGVSSPAALSLLDDLEALGCVSRARNAEDRRLLSLTLTEEGRSCLVRARQAIAGVQARIVAQLGPAGDADLRAMLSQLLSR
ncbi:MAG: MarR family transcriptional regulator, partial [Nocardioidaceae bacterium]|nr:MarR family transcriptional regulator [Nocardioidaceae bacterium]